MRGFQKKGQGETESLPSAKASTPKTKKPQVVCRRLEAKPPNPKGRKMKETLHTTPDKINDRIRQAGRLLVAVQSASARRHDGSYSFSHVSDDVKLVVWDHTYGRDTICIIEFGVRRALFIQDEADAHRELHESLSALDDWEVHPLKDSPMARAASEWVA